MSFENFKPAIVSKEIIFTYDDYAVGLKNSRDYSGEVAADGVSVTVNNMTRPTSKEYTGVDIDAPEELDGTEVTIDLDQKKYTNSKVGDIDKAQAKPDVWAGTIKEIGQEIISDSDKYIYSLYGDAGKTITETADVDNIADIVLEGKTFIYDNNVPMNEALVLEVSPAIYSIMVKAKLISQTPNEMMWQNGYVGKFLDTDVYMTNNLSKNGNAYYCFLRTRKAIGFAQQLKHTEPYRDPKNFYDGMKTLNVYGGTVMRPNELVVLELTAGSLIPSA